MGLNRSEGGPDKVARLPKGWTGPESMSGNPGGEIHLGFFMRGGFSFLPAMSFPVILSEAKDLPGAMQILRFAQDDRQ